MCPSHLTDMRQILYVVQGHSPSSSFPLPIIPEPTLPKKYPPSFSLTGDILCQEYQATNSKLSGLLLDLLSTIC